MKDFTSSPIYHILCNIFDLVVLNLFYLLCCLPIVTAGPATAALYRSIHHMHREEGSPLRDFFPTLKHTLKIGTLPWVGWLLAMAIVCGDFAIIGFYWDFPGRFLILGLLALCVLVLLLWGSCLFAVLSFYPGIKIAMVQSFRLCFQYLPRMIPVCLLNLIPLWIFFCWNYGFLLLTAFFLLIWFSLSAYINAIFLRPVLSSAAEQSF